MALDPDITTRGPMKSDSFPSALEEGQLCLSPLKKHLGYLKKCNEINHVLKKSLLQPTEHCRALKSSSCRTAKQETTLSMQINK